MLNWLFGILFLIASISSFENSLLDAISSFIISCLLLPPIRQYIYKITKINISAGSRGLIIFLLLIFIGNTEKESPFDESNNYKLHNQISWALYEKPLLVVVEIDSYKGDIIESGRYKVKVENIIRLAEIFNIIVSNRELSISECISIIRNSSSTSYKSDVKAEYYHHTAGGIQNNPITINLSKGQYIHVVPNTYYFDKRGLGSTGVEVSGVLSIKKI